MGCLDITGIIRARLQSSDERNQDGQLIPKLDCPHTAPYLSSANAIILNLSMIQQDATIGVSPQVRWHVTLSTGFLIDEHAMSSAKAQPLETLKQSFRIRHRLLN